MALERLFPAGRLVEPRYASELKGRVDFFRHTREPYFENVLAVTEADLAELESQYTISPAAKPSATVLTALGNPKRQAMALYDWLLVRYKAAMAAAVAAGRNVAYPDPTGASRWGQ